MPGAIHHSPWPCMNCTIPKVSAMAAIEPISGHGLGSTRWYGWCGLWASVGAALIVGSFVSTCRSIERCRLAGAGLAVLCLPHLLLRRLGVIGAEEGVGQGDVVEALQLGVLQHCGIDEEADRHLHPLARLQGLLREAEALDLGEILAVQLRRHVEAGTAGHRLRFQVLRDIVDELVLADPELDAALRRLELPMQA